jgi:type III secretory pathway component EscR
MSGRRAHIEKLIAFKSGVEEQIQEKFTELNQLRADVKVIEKMREKDFNSYRKKIMKKQNAELEETLMNWKQSREG